MLRKLPPTVAPGRDLHVAPQDDGGHHALAQARRGVDLGPQQPDQHGRALRVPDEDDRPAVVVVGQVVLPRGQQAGVGGGDDRRRWRLRRWPAPPPSPGGTWAPRRCTPGRSVTPATTAAAVSAGCTREVGVVARSRSRRSGTRRSSRSGCAVRRRRRSSEALVAPLAVTLVAAGLEVHGSAAWPGRHSQTVLDVAAARPRRGAAERAGADAAIAPSTRARRRRAGRHATCAGRADGAALVVAMRTVLSASVSIANGAARLGAGPSAGRGPRAASRPADRRERIGSSARRSGAGRLMPVARDLVTGSLDRSSRRKSNVAVRPHEPEDRRRHRVRVGDVHEHHGHHDRQRRAAHDRPRLPHRPHRGRRRRDRLPGQPGRLHPGVGLAGRPLRRQAGAADRHRRLHGGFGRSAGWPRT